MVCLVVKDDNALLTSEGMGTEVISYKGIFTYKEIKAAMTSQGVEYPPSLDYLHMLGIKTSKAYKDKGAGIPVSVCELEVTNEKSEENFDEYVGKYCAARLFQLIKQYYTGKERLPEISVIFTEERTITDEELREQAGYQGFILNSIKDNVTPKFETKLV